MAYSGGGYGSGGSYFGGYAGGYSQTPSGFIVPSNNTPYAPGFNAPSVDPNNYSGVIHFGQPTQFVGPMSTGYTDPNLNIMGGANYYGGF